MPATRAQRRRQRRLRRKLTVRGRQLSGLRHYGAYLKVVQPLVDTTPTRFLIGWARWCLRHQCMEWEHNTEHRMLQLARGILHRMAMGHPAVHFFPGQLTKPPFTLQPPDPNTT